MAIGTVNEFCQSRSGKPQVKIDGAYYFVGKCNIDGMSVGDKIEFESNLFGDRMTLKGLQTWKRAQGAAPAAANGNGARVINAVSDDATMRFISNVVGSAITAGTIKDPKDIAPWYRAAKAAATLRADPELDDDIPY